MAAAHDFLMSCQSAKRAYAGTDRTEGHGNRGWYFGDCFYAAMSLLAAELAAANPKDPRLKYLSTAVSASRHAVKAIAVTVHNNFSCPVDSPQSHRGLLGNLANNLPQIPRNLTQATMEQMQRDLNAVKDVLRQLGVL